MNCRPPRRPSGIHHSSLIIHHSEAPDPEPLIPPIIIDCSPTIHYPLFTIHSSLGGWLFSYAAATVIMGMAILGAWAYKVSHDYGPDAAAVADNSRGLTAPGGRAGEASHGRSRNSSAGSPAWPIAAGPIRRTLRPTPAVPLGRKYALASGLMEITYTDRGQGHPPRALHL